MTTLFVEFLLTFERHLIPLMMISSWSNLFIMVYMDWLIAG